MTLLAPERTQASAPADATPASRRWWSAAGAWVRSNRLFTALLVVAVVLRALVLAAYAPALEFFGDSFAYLYDAQHLGGVSRWHPPGYAWFLRLLSVTHTLVAVTLLQHLFGLLAAVLVYRLMRRLGVGSLGGCAASLPLLVDGYQLDLEQFVLSDTLYTLLLVAALLACQRLARRPSDGWAVATGLLLAAGALTRTVGLVVALPVAVVLVWSRLDARRLATVGATFALPLLGYVAAFHASYGVWALQGYGGRYLYGTVAPFADCHGLQLPAREQVLCPQLPSYARPGFNQYVWENSPFRRLRGAEIDRSQVAGSFARTVALHQPGPFLAQVAGNLAHYAEPGRTTGPRDWFVGSWQLPTSDHPAAWNITPAAVGFGGTSVRGGIDEDLAAPLRAWQSVVFTPGPLLLAALLLTVVALARRRGDLPERQAAALLAGSGLLLLAVPAVTAGFDWRYVLPAQAVLVPAGVLAAHLLARRWAAGAAVTRAVACAAVLALALPGLPASAADSTARLGGRLSVQVGPAHAVAAGCVHAASGYRWEWLTAFPVHVTYRSGAPMLVQPSNFWVTGQPSYGQAVFPVSMLGAVLPSAVLSSRYPRISGDVFMALPTRTGRVHYADPGGAGTASWSFTTSPPPATAGAPPLGAPCMPPARAALPAPRFPRLPAVTEATTQTLVYGPRRARTTIVDYDVRWRAGTSEWRYPPVWQHTAATTQTFTGLGEGATYCFSVRAHTSTGKTTAWSNPRCVTRLLDDTGLGTDGGWQRVPANGFYDNGYLQATAPGAVLTVRPGGSYARVAVVAYRCPTCGSLQVLVGGAIVKQLSLRSTAARQGLFLWRSRTLRPTSAAVTLRAGRTRGVVAVDAAALLPPAPAVITRGDRARPG